jgi:putative ABC transport system permease protein
MLRIDLGQLSGHPGLSPAEAIDLRKSGLFASVEVETRLTEVSYGPPDHLVAFRQINFTTGMLPMLGVSPVIGRNFTEDDIPQRPAPPPPGTPPAPPAPRVQRILLDYAAWQTYFGGDRSVIGRVIQINGGPSEIIGVLPDNFRLATGRAVPQRVDVYGAIRLTDFRNAWQYPTLAKLKPGSTFAEVQAGLDTLAPALKKQYPEFYDGRLRFTATPVLDDITKDSRPALGAATGAVLLLLVIAFANATALVVARLKGRESDLAIRAAMGASRAQLVADVLAEATVLAAGGLIVGGLFAVAAVAGIREVMPRTVPRWEEIAVGWDVLLYAGGLSLAGLFASGLIPLWKNAHDSTAQTLRAGSVQGGKAEGTLSRLLLVGSQIALTVVLAFGCLQLARSASALRHVNLGYDPNVLTLQVPLDFRTYGPPEKRAGLYQRIRDRVKLVPGVTSVGVVTHVPLSGSTMMDGYQADLSKEPSFDQSANYQAVTPGYFDTLKIPILQGRDFTDQEDAQHQNVIIVDETLVRTVFPGETNVLGRTLRLGWGLPNAQIVGVVGHARTIEVGRAVRPQIYAPISNLFQSVGIVTVRATGNALALAPAIVRAIDEVGPNRAVANVAMLSDNVKAATSTLIAVTELVTFLALSAGLLSAAGLYLVIAYVVHQRRRATAIRAALGASRTQVIWEHGRTSANVICMAVPVGAGLALVIAPMLGTLVYGVSPRDPVSLAVAVVGAVFAGIAGTYVPVLRAANANIVKILRGD